MFDLELRSLSGPEIGPWLPALAALRIEVFREYPYLYDGDLDYERRYLATYAASPECLFLLAFSRGELVGASTGMPLADEVAELQQPFVDAGMALPEVFYFGESVVRRGHRGSGFGSRFFDAREAYARHFGRFRYTAFCAVRRPPAHPQQPQGYRPLHGFWQRRGYQHRPDLVAWLEWQQVGEAAPSAQPLEFWLRAL